MSFEKLQNTFKSYRRLLEADTLGSFDFFTCIICLDSIDTNAFDMFLEARKSKDYLYLSKVTPLAINEFTHFVEFFSFNRIAENHKEKELVRKVTVVVALDLGCGNTNNVSA